MPKGMFVKFQQNFVKNSILTKKLGKKTKQSNNTKT